MNKIQEDALIADVIEGNHDSYRYFIDRYHKGLILHLHNILNDGDAAEDAAQEAFIKAYDNLSKYNKDFAFSTWLYKIADNIAFRILKKNSRFVELDEDIQIIDEDSITPDEFVEKQFNKEKVRQSIDKLPTKYKLVISLFYWDNLDYKQIAEILDSPDGTIKTWIYRAKEMLRKDLYGQIR